MFRSECAYFSLYIYLSVYLIHGDKQQKSEHGIEARFYEIERNYRGDEQAEKTITAIRKEIRLLYNEDSSIELHSYDCTDMFTF